jgi:choline kinase
MRGIILAAGKGERLNGISREDPKCLVAVGGLTLIERQIRALKSAGVHDVTVVVGFGAERVRERCGPDVSYIENANYDRTNSLYSLWLASDLLFEGFVVLNADVLFHIQLLRDLLKAQYEDALLVGYRDEATAALGDEEMKVKVRKGQVVDISKEMSPRDADGENVGIVKFGPLGARLLVECMNLIVSRGNGREWAPSAFRDFAIRRQLHAISTRGYPWIEIDFPEDLDRAANEILPRINLSDESFISAPTAAAAISIQNAAL